MPRVRRKSPLGDRRPSSALSCISEASMSSYEEGEIVVEKVVQKKKIRLSKKPLSPIPEYKYLLPMLTAF